MNFDQCTIRTGISNPLDHAVQHHVPHLMREVNGHCGQDCIVRQSLLSIHSSYNQSGHHGRHEAAEPRFGLLMEHQCSRFHSDLDVVLLVLIFRRENRWSPVSINTIPLEQVRH